MEARKQATYGRSTSNALLLSLSLLLLCLSVSLSLLTRRSSSRYSLLLCCYCVSPSRSHFSHGAAHLATAVLAQHSSEAYPPVYSRTYSIISSQYYKGCQPAVLEAAS